MKIQISKSLITMEPAYPHMDHIKQPLKEILTEMLEYSVPDLYTQLCDAIKNDDTETIAVLLVNYYCTSNNDWYDMVLALMNCEHLSMKDVDDYKKLVVKYTSYQLLKKNDIFHDTVICVASKLNMYKKKLIFTISKIMKGCIR